MIRRRIFEEEHRLFRDTVQKWAQAELVPRSEEFRELGMIPKDVWRSAGEQGFLCMWAEEAHGGLGLDDFRFDQILAEETAGIQPSFFLALHNRIVGPYLKSLANEEQKSRFLPKVTSGETVLSVAMTEPGTGSDLAGMKANARDNGDHWLLNGTKTYISNGIISDLCIVAAKTDPDNPYSVGLFLVEEGMKGFERGRKLRKLGLQAQDTAELFFEDVEVPKENVLGDPTGGFKAMMLNLAEERLIGAITFAAHAERAFDLTMEFIQERNVFGKPIAAFQNSRFKMADVRTKLDTCWALIDHCVLEHIDGQLTAELASEAKLFTSETEGWIVDECLQLHGGAGYMDEYEISRLYADARVSRIYAGTSEIMREIIARSLGLK